MSGRCHLATCEPLATLSFPVAADLLTAGRSLFAARNWALDSGRWKDVTVRLTLATARLLRGGRWPLVAW
jgi:hypothetical protein